MGMAAVAGGMCTLAAAGCVADVGGVLCINHAPRAGAERRLESTSSSPLFAHHSMLPTGELMQLESAMAHIWKFLIAIIIGAEY